MSAKLTTRQQQILAFIRQELVSNGYPPTRAEICQHFGFKSPNAAEDHLRALVRKGAIELRSGVSRGIHLVDHSVDQPGRLPLVGRVAAGSPILALENIEDRIKLGPAIFATRPDYLLKVNGMSMRDAGIFDGDYIAVQRSDVADENEIVVARIEDEVTVKRYSKRENRIKLSPENPDFAVLEINLARTDFSIEGIVVGVIRKSIERNDGS